MSTASWALQKAIYELLSEDAAIKGELGDPPRIFDDPPTGAAFPYVVIGESRAELISGYDSGIIHDVRLRIYSRHAGRREVKRVIDALYDALHEQDFPVDGQRLIGIRFVFADAFRRSDGELYQGVARFRAVTEVL